MTLTKKLGKQLEALKADLPVKTIKIDLGEVKFDLKVRVPLKKDMEAMNARILTPPVEKVNAVYENMASPLRKTLEEGGEEFMAALKDQGKGIELLENDLIVDGTSLRQVASFTAIEEQRVEEYFHLLVSETGEPVTESYDQIVAEFPDFVIKEIVAAIQGVIAPDYKTAKKN